MGLHQAVTFNTANGGKLQCQRRETIWIDKARMQHVSDEEQTQCGLQEQQMNQTHIGKILNGVFVLMQFDGPLPEPRLAPFIRVHC